ncbi:MAG: TetR/AcrR family transcriptional regulator [Acidimicrobiales bacterium]
MTPPLDPRVERTRAVVHDAAVALFAEAGLEGFTMEALAERSGVARSTIYRHWPDRAELLASVFDAVSPMVDDDAGDPVGVRLRRRGERFAHGLEEERWGQLLPFIVAAAQHDKSVREALDRFNRQRRSSTRELLAAAVDAGEIDGPADVDLVIDRYIGPFFFRLLVTQEPIDEEFVAFQLRGLASDLGLDPDALEPGDPDPR